MASARIYVLLSRNPSPGFIFRLFPLRQATPFI
jgi:hypothetical protein